MLYAYGSSDFALMVAKGKPEHTGFGYSILVINGPDCQKGFKCPLRK